MRLWSLTTGSLWGAEPAYGLPAGTLYWISTLQLAGSTVIGIDEYPLAAGVQPPGSTGITSVTFAGRRPEAGSPHAVAGSSRAALLGASVWALTGPFGVRLEVVTSKRHV